MEHCENQLEYLCTIAEADELPPSAVVVYIHLLNINRRLHWREWFSVANSTLANITKLGSNKTIVSAKNRLKQAGLIDFKSDGKKTTRYLLITHDSTQDTTHNTTQLKRYINTERDDAKKKQVKKFVPPTLEEVSTYCQEKNLTVSPKRFFDYYDAGEWKDGNGKPVKNWKQKLQTWQAHEPEKESAPCQPTLSPEEIARKQEENMRRYEAAMQAQRAKVAARYGGALNGKESSQRSAS